VTGQENNGNLMEKPMTTLRIEHAINDFGTWQKAFDSFAEARTKAGVRSLAIRRPVDDPGVPDA